MLDSKMSFSLESCNQNKVPKNPKSTRDTKRFLKSSLNISLASLKLLPFFFFLLFSPQSLASKAQTATKKNKAGAYRARGDKFTLPPLSPVICQPFFFFPQLQLARLRAPSARLRRRIIHIRGGTMEEAIYMCGSIDL